MRIRVIILIAVIGFGFTLHAVEAAEVVNNKSPEQTKRIEELKNSGIQGFLEEVPGDAKYLLTAPMRIDRKSALMIGGVAVSIGGLFLFDDDIMDYFQRNRTDTRDDVAEGLETLGAAGTLLAGNLGLAGVGFWFREQEAGVKLLQSALVSTEAQLFAEGITGLAKFAVGRNRPGEGHGKSSFDSFHDFHHSFPSGHAARSFAVAAVFADRYGQPIPFIAYTAASLISLSRIYDNDHFASDVLAGAVLGFVLGKTLSNRHREPHTKWAVLPFLMNDEEGFGLSFLYAF